MSADYRERELLRQREQQRFRKRYEQKKKRKSRAWLTMLAVLAIGGILLAGFTVLFPVKSIQVTGDSRYSYQEIVNAAKIEVGTNLLRLNPNRVEDNIRSICAYITQVQLQRKLPNRVILTVVEESPFLAFYEKGQYVLTTKNYEYIETVSEEPMATVIYGVLVTADRSGQPVSFLEESSFSRLDRLLKELEAQSIADITKIDLRDPDNLRMQYKKLHIWNLGDETNLTYKLQFGKEVSKREGNTGTVDLSSLSAGKNGYFKSEVLGDFVTETDVTPAHLP